MLIFHRLTYEMRGLILLLNCRKGVCLISILYSHHLFIFTAFFFFLVDNYREFEYSTDDRLYTGRWFAGKVNLPLQREQGEAGKDNEKLERLIDGNETEKSDTNTE